MTAEIAIMNLQAVALAADSALTASNGRSQKIFTSANKLFALSDINPVGILIYGNASFMSIPWETIVKEYRRILGKKTFDRLQEYTVDFCQFLTSYIGEHISDQHQHDFACSLASRIFNEIKREINRRTKQDIVEIVGDSGKFDIEKVGHLKEQVTVDVVNEYLSRARKANYMEEIPNGFEKVVRDSLGRELRKVRLSVFDDPFHQGITRKLNTIAIKSIVRIFDEITAKPPSGLTSGVVVAGFGEYDIYPAISHVRLEGMVQGRLKRNPDKREFTLSPDNPSMIIPFAQSDMVHQFMQGIAPQYLFYLHKSIESHFKSCTDELLKVINSHIQLDIESLSRELSEFHIDLADSFMDNIEDYTETHFIQPIVNVVEMLPKEQLADMAESLVNLTALKKRVSNQDETVGGPTDVALITKGDGLIWIKRKHYFDPNLNPSYFAKLSYRRTRHGQETPPEKNHGEGEIIEPNE